jgi:signal transduction histidine kinase
VAVEKLVSQAIGAFEVQAQSRTISLKTYIPADLPNLYADEKRLGQVLRNLLGNALAHTPPGGEVSLQAQVQGDDIELTVKDTGSGVEAEQLPYIFERFYRTDNSRTRATGGAGLGLAIVKQLVELQGGRVWAESRAGEGLSVFIALPKFDAGKLSLETAPRS